MRNVSRNLAVAVLAAALVGPMFVAGCEGEVRTYDVDYHDYHTMESQRGGLLQQLGT